MMPKNVGQASPPRSGLAAGYGRQTDARHTLKSVPDVTGEITVHRLDMHRGGAGGAPTAAAPASPSTGGAEVEPPDGAR
jgi:hypothetical protein